jgi:hypothetical protein
VNLLRRLSRIRIGVALAVLLAAGSLAAPAFGFFPPVPVYVPHKPPVPIHVPSPPPGPPVTPKKPPPVIPPGTTTPGGPPPVDTAPEPNTLVSALLGGIGLALAAGYRRRQKWTRARRNEQVDENDGSPSDGVQGPPDGLTLSLGN